MTSAEKLDIPCIIAATTLGEGDDVVVVKAGLCATLCAATLVSLPDFNFHCGRNHSFVAVFQVLVLASLVQCRPKVELEHISCLVFLKRGINKMEYAFVKPHTGRKFFVHPDTERLATPQAVIVRRAKEFAIVCEFP